VCFGCQRDSQVEHTRVFFKKATPLAENSNAGAFDNEPWAENLKFVAQGEPFFSIHFLEDRVEKLLNAVPVRNTSVDGLNSPLER
jgi:hypothetical protein